MLPQLITSTGYTSSSSSSSSSKPSRTSKKRPPVFPKRLYDMLENAERDGYSHIISWLPDGKSFKIHVDGSQDEQDEKAIVEILKRTFNQTKFKSFLRQLQLYGFERTYKGPRRGECKHEMFVRGRRELLNKKSIEDFQRKASDNTHSSPKPIFTPLQVPSSSLPSMPLVKPLTRFVSGCDGEKGCSYFETSVIPTKLTNLVLSDSEDKADEDIFSLSTSRDRRVSLIPFEKGENVPHWTGVELQILQYAL